MTYFPIPIGDAEEGIGLRAQARLNEIDRRTSALNFRLGFVQWLVLPVFFVALGARVVGLFLGFGAKEEMVGASWGLGVASPGSFNGPAN